MKKGYLRNVVNEAYVSGQSNMSERPTPETDAAAWTETNWANACVTAVFASKLERERDKAREDLSTVVDAILKRDGKTVHDMTVMDRLAELHANERLLRAYKARFLRK